MWFRKKSYDDGKWNDLNREVMTLTREERMDDALARGKRLLTFTRREFGKNHVNLVTALNNLGIIHTLLRELDEAESYLLSALQAAERISGKISSEVAVVNMNLARLYTMKATMINETLSRPDQVST
jgi:ABC-type transporter Mla subunit MlaD